MVHIYFENKRYVVCTITRKIISVEEEFFILSQSKFAVFICKEVIDKIENEDRIYEKDEKGLIHIFRGVSEKSINGKYWDVELAQLGEYLFSITALEFRSLLSLNFID